MDLGGFFSRGAGAVNSIVGGGTPVGVNGGGFWDFLKNAGDWLGGSDAAGTPNWMNALGMAGNMYSGIAQQQAAKNLMKQQKAAFDFNKMLSERQISRENQANQNLLNAWNSSAFGKRKDEDEGY
jgi:hypothetical protein